MGIISYLDGFKGVACMAHQTPKDVLCTIGYGQATVCQSVSISFLNTEQKKHKLKRRAILDVSIAIPLLKPPATCQTLQSGIHFSTEKVITSGYLPEFPPHLDAYCKSCQGTCRAHVNPVHVGVPQSIKH